MPVRRLPSNPNLDHLRYQARDLLREHAARLSDTAQKIREFHFTLCAIAGQPTLLRVMEGLWLQTGPYLNLLYPDYIASSRSPARRLRITKALQARDGASARREIEADIGEALSYVAGLADETGMIAPAQPVETRRRRRASPLPAGALAFVQSERN